MAKGGRFDIADMVRTVGETSIVSGEPVEGVFRRVPLATLAPNPENPRDSLGDLSGLATIAERQLQPALAVTRSAWLRIFPQHSQDIGAADYVIVNGCRRLAAANKYGADGFDIIIRDSVAQDAETVLWAAVVENLDRSDFDVIEEAKAVRRLVDVEGTAAKVAKRLEKSGGWVSQRLALLELEPELQQALRDGELAVREARSLARVPRAEQVSAWRRATATSDTDEGKGSGGKAKPEPREAIRRTLQRTSADPTTLAGVLREEWDDKQIRSFIKALQGRLPR